jgi:DNA polymerase-4
MSIFRSVAPIVEAVSLDEAYLEVTGVVEAGCAPIDLARNIKQRVRNEVGLSISIGTGSSKSVAKIASDAGKPDGLVVIEPGKEREFLAPLPVRKLWGIGPKTEEKLAANNIRTLGELANQPDDWMEREFGSWGPQMKAWSLGQDNRSVTSERPVKSVSAEVTFAQDVDDPQILADELFRLISRVAQRMTKAGIRGRTVNLKLRLSDFTTLTRSTTLSVPVEDVTVLNRVAKQMLRRELTTGRRLRLIGVGVSNFASTGQLPLFDQCDLITL